MFLANIVFPKAKTQVENIYICTHKAHTAGLVCKKMLEHISDLSVYVPLAYLAIVNVVTFVVYGVDKWKARRSKWRIPEATLLGLAAIGGSIGAWMGMWAWHHKTMHLKFKYGVPLILAVQIALVLFSLGKIG